MYNRLDHQGSPSLSTLPSPFSPPIHVYTHPKPLMILYWVCLTALGMHVRTHTHTHVYVCNMCGCRYVHIKGFVTM